MLFTARLWQHRVAWSNLSGHHSVVTKTDYSFQGEEAEL